MHKINLSWKLNKISLRKLGKYFWKQVIDIIPKVRLNTRSTLTSKSCRKHFRKGISNIFWSRYSSDLYTPHINEIKTPEYYFYKYITYSQYEFLRQWRRIWKKMHSFQGRQWHHHVQYVQRSVRNVIT